MSIMLNESNSSFDTTPSFDFVMRHDDGRDDEVVMSDVGDEDEGYDVIDDENEHREDVGVLIVPPTTGSSEDSRKTVLSIPDSVPTVMNSAMLDLPECVHVLDNAEATPVRSNPIQVSIHKGVDRDSFSHGSKNEDGTASQNTWRRNVLALVFVVAVSTGSVCHTFYLHRESLLLKEQVRLLTDQAARSAATLDELKQKQAQEIVFDNCWLQAHAKMSFGECSQEATETVKDTVNTFGSSIQNFWEKMKDAYQENMNEGAKGFHGFYHSSPPNKTKNVFGTNMKTIWKQWKKVRVVSVTEKVNRMRSNLQDVWNQTKGIFHAGNSSGHVGSNFYSFWVDIKEGVCKEELEGRLYSAGRSLYEAPSNFMNILKSGYDELKDSVNESIFYRMSDTAESNTTSADMNETDSLGNFVQNVNGLQSISKKVLVAAAWSAGAAILVSAFDMYWNQHGSLLALEN